MKKSNFKKGLIVKKDLTIEEIGLFGVSVIFYPLSPGIFSIPEGLLFLLCQEGILFDIKESKRY